MAEHVMHVLGGVRYRAQDVKRLGLVVPPAEQEPEPEPVVTTATAKTEEATADGNDTAAAGRSGRPGGKASS